MARPRKNNADYFSHDNDMRNDDRIRELRRKYSHVGYSIWCMLLERICASDDFKMLFTEDKIKWMCGDLEIDPEKLKEIVDYMIELKLLQKKDDFIVCEKLVERLGSLLQKRKRQRDIPENIDSDN